MEVVIVVNEVAATSWFNDVEDDARPVVVDAILDDVISVDKEVLSVLLLEDVEKVEDDVEL